MANKSNNNTQVQLTSFRVGGAQVVDCEVLASRKCANLSTSEQSYSDANFRVSHIKYRVPPSV